MMKTIVKNSFCCCKAIDTMQLVFPIRGAKLDKNITTWKIVDKFLKEKKNKLIYFSGLQDAISKNILVSDPSVLSARVLAMNATTGALLNCAWWQKQGLEMGGPKKVAETIMEVGHRPSTDYPW